VIRSAIAGLGIYYAQSIKLKNMKKILELIQKGELDKAAKLTATSYEHSDSKFFMIRLNIIIKYGDKNSHNVLSDVK
jgi:hypothetical protein